MLLLLGAVIPQTAETSMLLLPLGTEALTGLWRHRGLNGLLSWGLRVGWQPCGKGASFFDVVAAEDAAYMSIVFGVAILFA